MEAADGRGAPLHHFVRAPLWAARSDRIAHRAAAIVAAKCRRGARLPGIGDAKRNHVEAWLASGFVPRPAVTGGSGGAAATTHTQQRVTSSLHQKSWHPRDYHERAGSLPCACQERCCARWIRSRKRSKAVSMSTLLVALCNVLVEEIDEVSDGGCRSAAGEEADVVRSISVETAGSGIGDPRAIVA
eukprot:6207726-Pleurochrysis_carterae.AAC.1